MQQQLLVGAGGLLVVAVASGVAEWRRQRRRDMDKVGLVPWQLVQMLALIGAAMCVVAAWHR